ncbi:Hypothetical predicted protein [Paramuricea clavata]|uniref:Uncharacterized protein n=1 Tax=Paramuricea clavata TaxID=317549 RepID=A0A6S7IGQ6_PARCT|nr:Hypothetical predicted protein [Paramuricea clavata]
MSCSAAWAACVSFHTVVCCPWLGGMMGSICDILAYDDSEECWSAYATIRQHGNTEMYWIPREWVQRIVVNKHEDGHLIFSETPLDSEYILKLLEHILMCKICNEKLKDFLRLLDECVSCTKPCKDYMYVTCELYFESIPCNIFVIDGEFDEMRDKAYRALASKIDKTQMF